MRFALFHFLLLSSSVENYLEHFFDAINEQDLTRYRYAKHEMNSVLEGLWDFAVKLILDELGFTQMPPHDRGLAQSVVDWKWSIKHSSDSCIWIS